MRLQSQIIQKFYNLSEENIIRKNYKRAIWQFYNSYLISLSITRYKDKNINKKNRLIRSLILSPEELDSKIFKKIQKYMEKDIIIIFKALRKIELEKESGKVQNDFSSDPRFIGILAYELEN
jgi:hypothetical protein